MSQNQPLPQSPPPRRRGWGAIIVGFIGVILLLPGLCALGFMASSSVSHQRRVDRAVVDLFCDCVRGRGVDLERGEVVSVCD